ncbi:MAG TPA: hypothetical protein PLX88_05105 [Syntrophorhabdaceae bacterium]|jgi:hypothetical protein|nr:hypothetical protein [Syntrophorhabdaceae bacterium]HPN97946.1 hypothetical protein [Syntrophorhabdaceae bacterium]
MGETDYIKLYPKAKKAANAIKTLSTIIVFGVPLVVGVAVLTCYGACKTYKRIFKNKNLH